MAKRRSWTDVDKSLQVGHPAVNPMRTGASVLCTAGKQMTFLRFQTTAKKEP